MQLNNQFDFTQELMTNFDQRISQYDDLVRVTLTFRNVLMRDKMKSLSFNKIAISTAEFDTNEFSSFLNDELGLNISGQFTSTNRPYNLMHDIVSGYLQSLSRAPKQFHDYTQSPFEFSLDTIDNIIDANPQIYRNHDKTVARIIRDFHTALSHTISQSFLFIKKEQFFIVGSYRYFATHNPQRLSLKEPGSSIKSGSALHVYDTQNNVTMSNMFLNSDYHTTLAINQYLRIFRDKMPKIMSGEEDEFLKLVAKGGINAIAGSLLKLMESGFVIQSVNYTVRDDIDSNTFFRQRNSQFSKLYPIINGVVHEVSVLDLRSHMTEKEALYEIVQGGFGSTTSSVALPAQCALTGHYLFNTNRIGNVDEYIFDMIKNIPNRKMNFQNSFTEGNYYYGLPDVSMTKAVVDHIKSHLKFVLKERCDRCMSQNFVIEGDVEKAFEGFTDSWIYENLVKFIKEKEEENSKFENLSTFENLKLCSRCYDRVVRTYNIYNGYFKRDYFIGPDSVPDAIHIDEADHVFIQDYDFEPIDFIDLSNNDAHPSLGVELEVDSDDDTDLDVPSAATMAQLTLTKGANTAYLMHDGSLSCGFELATFPATVYQHMDPNVFDYEKAFAKLVRAGFRGHDAGSAGIHVHISRWFFGSNRSAQLYRASLMAYIMESNWEDFVKFSRRRYHHLDQWAKKKEMKERLDMRPVVDNDDYSEVFVNEYQYDKYVALNINHNNTFELRIFRSTLNYNTYLATLQFVHNLANLVKTIDLAKAQLTTFKDIIKFERFEALDNYVKLRFGDDFLE